jgi:hypothetical protein
MNHQQLEQTLDQFQESATEVISNVMYWVAPVPIAYLVYRSIHTHFAMPVPIALASALATEAVGMMAFHTMSRIQRSQLDRDVPAHLVQSARLAVLLYIVQVLVFTLFSDVVAGAGRWSILAYVPIAASSYWINGLRRQHNQLTTQKLEASYQLATHELEASIEELQASYQLATQELQVVRNSYQALSKLVVELTEQLDSSSEPALLELEACPKCGQTSFKSRQARGGHIGGCKGKAVQLNGHGGA